ncbi:T. brucei spp.-specific protein [Trypanosoma brucei gambiense DAL972]|uniref:Uncharacterized protein n=1 Tax=Trypanosoma brucei gambiense (strain MHOM/CI/86/DAL972) TaxID=679716 RepID=D0A487_TRYB9|nr:T. brucei spp.-specific protein [Trypanosoma brucei gambiense DAL972]CBH16081.1 T. brucei spp.-specific protein [Trypanosoma brucei gambiense DAL972]|eukprot:XP_011778345.1 T. brucei spp.-specific protein [Trypanosoma brucei gambiense DAL972]
MQDERETRGDRVRLCRGKHMISVYSFHPSYHRQKHMWMKISLREVQAEHLIVFLSYCMCVILCLHFVRATLPPFRSLSPLPVRSHHMLHIFLPCRTRMWRWLCGKEEEGVAVGRVMYIYIYIYI